MRISPRPPDGFMPGVAVLADGRSIITGWAVDLHFPTSHGPLTIFPTAAMARAIARYWSEHHGARVQVLACEAQVPVEYGEEWAETWGLD